MTSDIRECLTLAGALDGKFWEFTADLAKGDTAYTNIALGAHTDNTYFVCKPITHSVPWLRDMPVPFRQIPPDFNSSTSSLTQMDQAARLS